MESNCVPPGFRFHPTDEELVGYYLKKKVASEKIDLDVIRDIDLYRIEPWDLQEWCRIGYEEQKEWYFFSHKDKKYPTGTRTNRATMVGFWKATGRDKSVYDHKNKKLIGMRKTLVFYKGRAPNGQKTDWIIHEYRLESDENGAPQEEGWVVCRAFKKRTNNLTQKANAWDSSLSNYYYDDQPSGVISISSNIDSIDYINPRKQQHHPQQNLICKQEIESDNILNCLKSSELHDGDIHHILEMLPQLESPSLPSVKTPRFMSSPPSVSVTNEDDDQEQYLRGVYEKNKSSDDKKVMDWRALDKFVASQLSQEDRHDGEGEGEGGGGGGGGGGRGSITITTTNAAAAAFDEITDHDLPAHYNSSDMELILLQSMISRRDQEVVEEENRLNGFLISASSSGSPSVDCQNNSIIRVCI